MISQLRIVDFRSIHDETIDGVGPLFAITGRNGSGKSNVLRALNLFFNGEIEAGTPIDLSRDFHRAAERKDRRVIRVEVSFDLPIPPFRWRQGAVVETARSMGFDTGSFSLAREWSLDSTREVTDRFEHSRTPGTWTPVRPEDETFIQLLLTRLIRYRYVPNHVHPITLIQRERPQLQHTLMTKLNRSRHLRERLDPEAPLQAMAGVAAELIQPVILRLTEAAPEIEVATIATPESWADIALTLDLELQARGESSRTALLHGSGHQSLVALSMLHLIDTYFSAAFGWHQATIWGLEEPEAYLHHELAYNVGRLLGEYASHERFQVLITTHSPTIVAFSESGMLMDDSACRVLPSRDLIKATVTAGIGPYVHPLFMNESKPLLLVEGPSDRTHLENAYQFLNRPNPWSIMAIGDLGLPGGSSAFSKLLNHHANALSARSEQSPVVFLLDHAENVQRLDDSLQALHPTSSAHHWEQNQANPELDTTEFRGIEAFLATDTLEAADDAGLIRLMRPAAGTPIGCRDLDKTGIASLCSERRDPEDYGLFEGTLRYLESCLTDRPMMHP